MPVLQKSKDNSWESYMGDFVGVHGFVTDPDTVINDPDALIEGRLQDKGPHRLPQDCLRRIDGGHQRVKTQRSLSGILVLERLLWSWRREVF